MSHPTFVVCIGASAGGVTAVQKFLLQFNSAPPFPVAIVQHMPEDSEIQIGLVYPMKGGESLEARDKMPLEKGRVYFAPPGYHLLIEKEGSLSLSQDEPVHFARPSIDVFFESAARSLGSSACGILLTGANSDGAIGLKAIQTAGGRTIVQNPKTAEMPVMPESALEIMTPDCVLEIENILPQLLKWFGGES